AKFDRAKFWEEFKKASFILTTTLLLTLLFTGCDNNKSKADFVVTADTNVSKVPGLSKYVTQEEVDSFAFRYWDIDHNFTKNRDPLMMKFKRVLRTKDTNKILNFLKEHNLSVDVDIEDKTTPLMYSSFYNDLNTSKELIKLGANIRAKDRYKLSPLAYAVENNSTLTAKLLLDSGVKFDELTQIQTYLTPPVYRGIEKIIVDGDNITIIYKGKWKTDDHSKDEVEPFKYIVTGNFLELTKMVLESGYKPQRLKAYPDRIQGISEGYDRNLDIENSVFSRLDDIPNYEPMLDLLLKYNVYGGELTKEQLKKAYDDCYYYYSSYLRHRDKMGNIFYIKPYKEHLEKHCPIENSTFKDIKEFFRYSNGKNKIDEIMWIGKTDKVIYKNSNNKFNNKPNNKE
ncbi:ankyrin repeat domain-containing protein, partial [Campylobacter blaseri]